MRIIATESTGNLTLKAALNSHRHLFGDIERLWREIHRLAEAVAAMHRLSHLHRAIRPENIYVKIDPGASDYHFKLTNFEWSVYMHEIEGPHYETDRLDYYRAPEVLAPIFGQHSKVRGVSYAADVYSLGLVLYELLVERFRLGELRVFRQGDQDYDSIEHRNWLIGLQRNIDKKFPEPSPVRLLLRMMLHPEASLRYSDLDLAVEDIATFAAQASRVHVLLHDSDRPPLLATTLTGEVSSPKSLRRFLHEARPNTKLPQDLAGYLRGQLQGARVYANEGSTTLYIQGKDYEFVADRFVWSDPAKPGAPKALNIPFFRVAGPRDKREGPVLATLPMVEVVDLDEIRRRLTREYHQVIGRAEVWRILFELAEQPEDLSDKPQRQFYSLLRLTADAEKALWQRQVIPYQCVGEPEVEGPGMIVKIKADRMARRVQAQNLEPLDRFTARQVAREDPYFELLKSDNPLTTSDEGLPWAFGAQST